MDTVGQFLLLLVGFFIGRFLLNLWSLRESLIAAAEEAEIAELDKLIHIVKQEKYEETYYWFDQDTDAFLAQGRNMEEIRTVLKQRFHNHVFVLNPEQMLHGPEFDTIVNFNQELTNERK